MNGKLSDASLVAVLVLVFQTGSDANPANVSSTTIRDAGVVRALSDRDRVHFQQHDHEHHHRRRRRRLRRLTHA